MQKPPDVFDRDTEWAALIDFATAPLDRAGFGIVYGRRRQGKSWLLERVAGAVSGWYWEATEGTLRQQLDQFSHQFQEKFKLPAAPRFTDWDQAFGALWHAAPTLIVIDEFQYLVETARDLPSILQRLVSRPGPRLIICGCALGAMRALLQSGAPLRGRASLELIVKPFDFRTAATYWGSGGDLRSAVRLHALVGGTPAYLDFAAKRTPAGATSFDAWVGDVLLNPAGALLREGRILTDEPSLHDRGLYHGILTAVAGGSTRRGQIAAKLGRPENTLAHPLNALVELTLLERVQDPIHARRSTYQLTEPLLRTYQVVISPNEGAIERRGGAAVWQVMQATAHSQLYGPHFEHLAREWIATYASEVTLGALPDKVGPSSVKDTPNRRELEVDAIATAGGSLIALGEAKWSGAAINRGVLASLEHRRTLLGARARDATLLLFSSGGFDKELTSVASRRTDLELVDLDRLYHGS